MLGTPFLPNIFELHLINIFSDVRWTIATIYFDLSTRTLNLSVQKLKYS